MLACLIDFESNHLDTSIARITEYGYAIYKVAQGTIDLSPEEGAQGFIWEIDYPKQSPEIVEVTGITDEMIQTNGVVFRAFFDQLAALEFNYFVAHNKSYDEKLFRAEVQRHIEQLDPEQVMRLLNTPWVCTIEDVTYPIRTKCRVLSHLALELGVKVDPSILHRALDDVLLLHQVCREGKVDLVAALSHAQEPWIVVQAIIPKPWNDGEAGLNKAKACGFGWQKPPRTDGMVFDKAWVKRIKKGQYEKEIEALGYPLKIRET